MERCRTCPFWENGKGNKHCLRCSYYKHFQVKSIKRNQIVYEVLPDALMENIIDEPQYSEIIDKIRKLPLDESITLIARYYLRAPIPQIAKCLKISPRTVHNKIKLSLTILKGLWKTVAHLMLYVIVKGTVPWRVRPRSEHPKQQTIDSGYTITINTSASPSKATARSKDGPTAYKTARRPK